MTFDDDLGHTETLTSAATATVGAVATAPTVSTVDVTSMPASGDTYGTGEMIQFTVTFDQDVTVTGTPEFEFCLGNSDGGSCTDGSPPPTRRRVALSSGSGTTELVFSYTVVAGDMDDNGIWIGDQGRTIKLDTGDAIRGTVGGLDAVLTHPSGGAQTGHKVNGEATDRAALVALSNATSGPNWTINTNWLTTAALSEWYGVTTDVDGRVTHVYLSQNELNGEIPVELGDLTNLEQLSLSQNMLSGAIPAKLGDLASLQQLYLNGNTDLAGPLPLTLPALSQLLVLDIRETTLCAPVNTAFQAWLATIDFKGTVCGTPPPPPPPPVPDAPTNLLADAGDAAVTLTWEAPEDDGGSAITDYEYRIDQTGEWISIGSTDTTHTVTGLVNGTEYVFETRAVTAAGSSAPSNRVEATPRAAVTLLVANFSNGNNGAFNSRVYLWNPSASAGQVTVRVFTLPLTTGIARELTGPPLDLGTLEARSALNLKLVEDILIPLEIALPYTTDGGNLTLEFTIQAVDVRGAAQVFSSDFAFGTYPMQEIPSTSSGSPTVLVANFTNGNNGALHSRVYLWNPSLRAGSVTVRVFTLPLTAGVAQELTTAPLDLGTLGAESARNLKLVEDILTPLGITIESPTPYVTDGGNLTLEFTIQAADVRGAAQVFSSSFAFGTVPLQVIQ